MTRPKVRAEFAALRVVALEDILNTPAAELRREAIADGEDIAAISQSVKSVMRDAAAAALRLRLATAKARMVAVSVRQTNTGARPVIAQLKKAIQTAFASDRSLGLAFRDGKQQSEADWESLYDDLVALGKIDLSSHED